MLTNLHIKLFTRFQNHILIYLILRSGPPKKL